MLPPVRLCGHACAIACCKGGRGGASQPMHTCHGPTPPALSMRCLQGNMACLPQRMAPPAPQPSWAAAAPAWSASPPAPSPAAHHRCRPTCLLSRHRPPMLRPLPGAPTWRALWHPRRTARHRPRWPPQRRRRRRGAPTSLPTSHPSSRHFSPVKQTRQAGRQTVAEAGRQAAGRPRNVSSFCS